MAIIREKELLEIAELEQRAALRKRLKEARIPFKELNGKIFTTEEAITASMVGRAKEKTGPNLRALESLASKGSR